MESHRQPEDFNDIYNIILNREIELEKQIYEENKSPEEKLTAYLSQQMAQEIDREILQELRKNNKIESNFRVDRNVMHVDVNLIPLHHLTFINIEFITS